MKIAIKKLSLTNFKGIKSLVIDFNHITNIFGENAAGKTTVMDAFLWLFFGKDSTDRKDFEIKPLDKNNQPIQKVDVEVSAVIDIDGKSIDVKKVLREKWQKKRGELTAEFVGNENLFYWNDVPLQLKQFQEKIDDILPERLFKLITNPLYFNSLKWQDRRHELLQIAGEINNTDILSSFTDQAAVAALKSLLNSDKSLDEHKREIAARKKKLKDELAAIPTRIDELNRTMPQAADFDAIRKTIAQHNEELNKIDEALHDFTKSLDAKHQGILQKKNQVHELATRALNIKNDVRNIFLAAHNTRKGEIADRQRLIDVAKMNLQQTERQIRDYEQRKDNLALEADSLRDKWYKINEEKLSFNEKEFMCPTCHRPLEASDVNSKKESLTENFNSEKAKRLQDITTRGTVIKTEVEQITSHLQVLEQTRVSQAAEVADNEVKLDYMRDNHDRITQESEQEFNKLLSANEEYQQVNKKIASLNEELAQPIGLEDNGDLKKTRSDIRIQIDALNKQLTDEDRIVQCKTRIQQLQKEEEDYAQQLASQEGSEFLIEQFTKAKMDLLVSRVNGKFTYVKFKMFDRQINGAEVECCDTLVDGVPFSDANNAAKINAGLDIINVLCQHYQVYAPIFIDNRESVNSLIDCDSQIVNLIVSLDKQLRVA